MRSRILNRREIRELDSIYLEALRTIESLRRANPNLGGLLALPRLPSALSESIAADCATRVFGSASLAFRPPGLSDLAVGTARQRKPVVVAVKGTGQAQWITVTKTDLLADCLLWVDYSSRITTGDGTVDVWRFAQRVSDWTKPRKITFTQAVKSHGKPERFRYTLGPIGRDARAGTS
jgi:hypothetical protein